MRILITDTADLDIASSADVSHVADAVCIPAPQEVEDDNSSCDSDCNSAITDAEEQCTADSVETAPVT